MSAQKPESWLKSEAYYLDQNYRPIFGSLLSNGGPYFSCEVNSLNKSFFLKIFAEKQVKIEFDSKDGQKKTIKGKVVMTSSDSTKFSFEFEGEAIPISSKVAAVYLKVNSNGE